jgi:hypothetical protein
MKSNFMKVLITKIAYLQLMHLTSCFASNGSDDLNWNKT